MIANFRVCLDACVLANHGVCDLLLRLAESPRLYMPILSENILKEVYRVHTERLNPPWPSELADYFQIELKRAFADSFVSDYESLIPILENDEKDRHVLAAAIKGQASLILTFNLKHFKKEHLSPWNLEAKHPDLYLINLYEMSPGLVMDRLQQAAEHYGVSLERRLEKLSTALPQFCQMITEAIH